MSVGNNASIGVYTFILRINFAAHGTNLSTNGRSTSAVAFVLFADIIVLKLGAFARKLFPVGPIAAGAARSICNAMLAIGEEVVAIYHIVTKSRDGFFVVGIIATSASSFAFARFFAVGRLGGFTNKLQIMTKCSFRELSGGSTRLRFIANFTEETSLLIVNAGSRKNLTYVIAMLRKLGNFNVHLLAANGAGLNKLTNLTAGRFNLDNAFVILVSSYNLIIAEILVTLRALIQSDTTSSAGSSLKSLLDNLYVVIRNN